jgi:UDP:flavonoid glycosyltransferase YjiC (YdhE family)
MFDQELADPVGWEKLNRHYIRRDHRGFLEFFFGQMFPEPHSTKQIEDAVAYGLDGSVDALLMDDGELVGSDRDGIEAICRQVACPVLVMHGGLDKCQPPERGRRFAALTGAEEVELPGAGHIPNARHPVVVNRLIRDFIAALDGRAPTRPTSVRSGKRTQRALLVSSPIGLGHAWRDVAIARELRQLVPGLEVQWLAQPPVSTLLAACGESIHPASEELAPEAAGVDAEAGEHQLHAFQMLRRLDEIFCANFMVFSDLVRDEAFDIWIADEAWEIDYFLHENPELKGAPYVWLTDFVGVLPMAVGGGYERTLAADYNAQMVEHIALHPRLRDASIFIGEPEDLVNERLGPDLPMIRDWTQEHYRFSGYITGFDRSEITDRDKLRREFGYAPEEKVCIVAAGGSGVGTQLLNHAAAAFPAARQLIPQLRMVLIAGPRVDPSSLAAGEGLETHGYVHQLYRQFAACDIAISHGGLSTTMELTAADRPFLYFPLRDHFEQNIHVNHRLRRHHAGRRMDIEQSTPYHTASALAEELNRPVGHLRIPADGATRAATIISELL